MTYLGIDFELALPDGSYAQFDGADFDLVASRKWHRRRGKNGVCYVASYEPGNKSIFLHRFLMNPEPGMVVDHRNSDGLDNRRSNLRICTPAENARNNRGRKNSHSIYKGVTRNRRGGKWCAFIKDNGKRTYQGSFDTEVEAAKAYDAAALRLYGEFARLNFPEE
jgi:hypothetical protein